MEYVVIILLCVVMVFLYLILSKLDSINYSNNNEVIQKQLKKVLDTLNQVTLLFDYDAKLLFYNKGAKESLNINDNYLNLTVDQIFDDNKIKEAIKNRKTYEVFDITHQGKVYLVNVYTIKKTGTYEKEVSAIVILKNITELRSIEQTKKDFFSHASHELKSPLTAILGYSELVALDMVAESEYKDIIARIHKQASHMTLLVDDMSTLSRLEAIPKDENKEYINLKDILVDTIETLDPFITEKNITLDIMIESIKYLAVSLDINKLYKNLIENAIKYSPKNSKIEIKLYTKNKEIVFSIKDNGIGIAPEHQQRVFERFYRIDKGRLQPGTGLGLAIVKHIVIKYQGKIELESELNNGTKIVVKLKTNE